MDRLIAARLDRSEGNKWFDQALSTKLGQTAKDYLDNGLATLNYYVCDFDAATDLVEMLSPVENSAAFAQLDRNNAINFRDPMAFTQLMTQATFVTQILFGGEQARTVEAVSGDQENAADSMNGLLAWNDHRLNIYGEGFGFVWNALVYNRGVWFERAAQDCKVEREEVAVDDFTQDKVPQKDDNGQPLLDANGNPVLGFPKIIRTRNKRIYSGFYNAVDLVSPYDFICDPTLPICRFQEGRFAGHRVMIPWIELKRRSELAVTDDQYVLPEVVARLKTQKGQSPAPVAMGQQTVNTTRTNYDRMQRGATVAGVSGMGNSGASAAGGGDSVNKDDGGVVECFLMIVRVKPKTLGLYDDDEAELIQLLLTNQSDILSAIIREDQHDEYPYCIGEGRPNRHRQFSPGYALAIKGPQDRIDQLNITHAREQARMGVILLIDDTKCNVANLLAPDKNGLMIMRTEGGRSAPTDEVVDQIPLKTVTDNYPQEAALWKEKAEDATGAHAFTQGRTEDPSQTLGQFDAVKQMATGRISNIARLLSENSLVPQTRRFAMNFQQYMPEEQMIRVLGKGSEFDPDNPPEKFALIKKSDVQFEFDVVPHDGSLPGADATVVAAATRAVEAWAENPMLAPAFDNTIPGSMDGIRIARDLLKKSGLAVDKYSVTRQQAIKNLQAKQIAAGQPPSQPPPNPDGNQPPAAGASPVPIQPTPVGGVPSAAAVPPIAGVAAS